MRSLVKAKLRMMPNCHSNFTVASYPYREPGYEANFTDAVLSLAVLSLAVLSCCKAAKKRLY